MQREIRQSELAELLGYEQSYISALEIGLKGPPTPAFIERLTQALSLSANDQASLFAAVEASHRKLVIDPDTSEDVYWLLKDLREKVNCLTPTQVRMMRDVLGLPSEIMAEKFHETPRRIRRQRKEEVAM
jgi:transcriptional regulator with XRE-family HTH domain